ncbi:type IV pilus modification PilV family protein [Crateriforma spongiae]|uniref:type IV pilus modification PilV family protein n=1 Tax=Crateriforma spongiae TaxID=2724528 RepID=UPI0039AEADDE
MSDFKLFRRHAGGRDRHGVTLVEVAFAMGIILIGLVGLVSILPIAGRQAKDAVSLNNATSLANAALAEFQARNYGQPGRWVLQPDFAKLGSMVPEYSDGGQRFAILENTPTFLNDLMHPDYQRRPGRGQDPTLWQGVGNMNLSSNSVCIDPLFVADPNGYLPYNAANSPDGKYVSYFTAGTNGHRRIRFPYYKANYNPLVNPSLPVTASNQWPPMPRLTRVTINRGVSTAGQFISGTEANYLSESGNDLNITKPKDQTLAPIIAGEAITGTVMTYGKAQTEGTYSWIATVNEIPGGSTSSVSVAVIENRDRTFFTYPNAGPEGTLNGVYADDPEANATEERVAYVTYAGGFTGGAGGTVEIVMSTYVDPTIIPGQWVMMSRDTLPGIPGGEVHRWFRVAGVVGQTTSGEPDRIIFNDPVHGTPYEVWHMRLMLDGPDWSFGFDSLANDLIDTPGPADGFVDDNTVMTLVRGVVSVTERTIRRP